MWPIISGALLWPIWKAWYFSVLPRALVAYSNIAQQQQYSKLEWLSTRDTITGCLCVSLQCNRRYLCLSSLNQSLPRLSASAWTFWWRFKWPMILSDMPIVIFIIVNCGWHLKFQLDGSPLHIYSTVEPRFTILVLAFVRNTVTIRWWVKYLYLRHNIEAVKFLLGSMGK